jgi:hypothetical protein
MIIDIIKGIGIRHYFIWHLLSDEILYNIMYLCLIKSD